MGDIKITCDTNCIDCQHYYACESEMKLDEESRNFWIDEEEKSEEFERIEREEAYLIESIKREVGEMDEEN